MRFSAQPSRTVGLITQARLIGAYVMTPRATPPPSRVRRQGITLTQWKSLADSTVAIQSRKYFEGFRLET